MSNNSGVIPVRVAVRIRPLSTKEIDEGCQNLVSVIQENRQIYIESLDKAFSYDFVFSDTVRQETVYEDAVKCLIPHLFKGYNVTVLAYGQTGSGKTHSMGTTNSLSTPPEAEGIIPRAIRDIFRIVADDDEHSCILRVSFIELYKEQLFDLLSDKSTKKDDCILDLREDPRGGIKIVNMTEVNVNSLSSTMNELERGSLRRVTAATAMNSVSSRSHAIFTLHIELCKKKDAKNIIVAKFHLVDLAGSERQKKTKATGERFKEGVDINKGLLCLGNVISALGEETTSGGNKHIPYRDSKLTRLLQDSLGGNSHTLMISCISPADSNVDETLSTLRYADRARKIKNKPIVNRDGKEAELNKLRSELAALKACMKGGGGMGGIISEDSVDLKRECEDLRLANKKLKSENSELTSALVAVQEEITHLNERVLLADGVNETLKTKLNELRMEVKSKMEEESEEGQNKKEAFEGILKKVEDVMTSQKNAEKTLVEHEMSRIGRSDLTTSSSTIHETSNSGGDDDEEEDEEEKKNAREFALRQNTLATQLQNLNKMLAQKEQLATAMNSNEAKFNEMKKNYEESLKNLEMELVNLQKEKEELLSHQKSEPSNKIAEDRRRRIQELETMIADMKKTMKEQLKAIRLNEKDKARLVKLSEEILSMKQAKVRLVRQMKEDAERVRQWKQEKERELMKVKQADRKNQVKIAKMETLHSKQKNVLKRKMEEITAMNAKLKAIVDKQKAVQKQRAASGNKGLVGAGERVRNWLQGEIDVVVGAKEAVQAREQLLKERANITAQIKSIRTEMRNTMGPEERAELDKKVASLETEVEDRNIGIANLQKHIDDLHKVKKDERWESMTTMTEAKIALDYMFEKASEALASNALIKGDYAEIQQNLEETNRIVKNLENEIQKMKLQHEDEVVRVSREHEEKVLFLLRQLPGFNDVEPGNDLEERLKLQEAEIRKVSQLNELLLQMREENDQLKKQLNDEPPLPLPPLAVPRPPAAAAKSKKGNASSKIVYMDDSLGDDEDEDFDVDSEEDPDWSKTPLCQRIKTLKKRSLSQAGSSFNSTKRKMDMDAIEEAGSGDTDEEEGGPTARKRSSKGSGCGCKTNCKTKKCPCRKNGPVCTDDGCNCDPGVCLNRSSGGGGSANNTALSDITNSTINTMSILNSDSFNISEMKDDIAPVFLHPSNANQGSPVKKKRLTMDGISSSVDSPPPSEKTNYFKSPIMP